LYHAEIVLMTTEKSEIRRALGPGVDSVVKRLLRGQRISYLPNVQITSMKGDSDLEAIHFHKEEDHGEDQVA